MKKTVLFLTLAFALILSSCNDKKEKTEKKETITKVSNKTGTTKVTPENYALAETQVIFTGYIKKIAAATGTDGVGVFMHNKKSADPKDRTIMRINFDILFSFVIVDLTEDLTLTMPETNGRYQSAWIINEEHYNPFSFEKPGVYKLTRENVGTRYAMIGIRTQVNGQDPKDIAIVNALQEKLKVEQKDRGSYMASNKWDMDEILKMRKKYQQIQRDKDISTDKMFGEKGSMTLEEHNVGTAYGWGGFTPKQAVYPSYFPKSTAAQTLTLKDVPINAFWSVTIYDKDGFPKTDTYNINSSFAKKKKDGSVVIHFGGDKNADNYMETFEGWNFLLRLYQPTEVYFDGGWKRPKLELVN